MLESPISKMQPPIFAIIRQRFVACVDDGAIKLHPLVDVVNDMIGPLAQLKIHPGLRPRRFEIESQRIGLTDPARAGENLPGGQKTSAASPEPAA